MPGKHNGSNGRPRHAAHMSETLKERLLLRLRRIEGQVRGLQRMVEEERYCPDVMEQVSAVQESLRATGQLLLRNHLQHCVTGAVRSGDQARSNQVYDELAALFFKHAR
ncbi:MAG TPA: metal-sensitive transcriptional regulator [Terriglobales bacterium]